MVLKQAAHPPVRLIGERRALLFEVLKDACRPAGRALLQRVAQRLFKIGGGKRRGAQRLADGEDAGDGVGDRVGKVTDGGPAPRRVLAHLHLVLLGVGGGKGRPFAAVQPLRHQPVREGEDGV